MLILFYDEKILKSVTRMLEFYNKAELLPLFESGDILSTNQIYMNTEAQQVLFDSMVENMSQNETYQKLSYEEAYDMIAYDFSHFAPQSKDDIDFDQLIILPIEMVYTDPEDNSKKN